MALTTYSELQTGIANWLERDDLTSRIPEFIALAESKMNRELRVQQMLERTAITVNAKYIDLPANFIGVRTFRLLTSPRTILEYVDPFEIDRYSRSGTGKPTRYTIHEQIEVDISPDQSYSGEMVYWEAPDALSDANTTNPILTSYPDVYLYGALIHTAPFLMHDERIPVWNSLYAQAVSQANKQTRKHPGPKVARVTGRGP